MKKEFRFWGRHYLSILGTLLVSFVMITSLSLVLRCGRYDSFGEAVSALLQSAFYNFILLCGMTLVLAPSTSYESQAVLCMMMGNGRTRTMRVMNLMYAALSVSLGLAAAVLRMGMDSTKGAGMRFLVFTGVTLAASATGIVLGIFQSFTKKTGRWLLALVGGCFGAAYGISLGIGYDWMRWGEVKEIQAWMCLAAGACIFAAASGLNVALRKKTEIRV